MADPATAGPGAPTAPGRTHSAPPSETVRRGAQLEVMGGLLLALGGLAAYGLQLPASPDRLAQVGPWVGVGFLGAWVGGALAGNTFRPLPSGARPAIPTQFGVAVLAIAAGVLSTGIVVRLQGLWSSPSQGVGPEVLLAGVGALLAVGGGLLMGHSMPRFVRRGRRGRIRGGT